MGASRCATTVRASPRRICRACSTASTARPTRAARPGSGLGLAIVRQVAETHGGSVHAANEPGGGARLTLELPPLAMTDDEVHDSARAGDAPTAERPFRKLLASSKAILSLRRA